MADKSIQMNVNEVLELEYLVEETSGNTIDVGTNESNAEINYLSKEYGVFNPNSTGTNVLTINGQKVEIEVVDIPDSVVSRTKDSNTTGDNGKQGLVVELKTDWPSIGFTISDNTSGFSRAYIYNYDDANAQLGTQIADKDISSKSAGDAVGFNDVNLTRGNLYALLVDAQGSSYTVGYTSASYPVSGSDLDIVYRWYGQEATSNYSAINDIGNTGL